MFQSNISARWSALVLFGWMVLGCTLAANADDAFVSATLPKGSRAFAADQQTGGVAIVDEAGALTLYPTLLNNGLLDDPIVDKSGALADSVVYKAGAKAGYFVTGCAKDQTVRIFNSKSLELVKAIAVKGDAQAVQNERVLMNLATSPNDKDPYVVCTGTPPHRINIDTLKDEGAIEISEQNPLYKQPDEIAVNADGSLLYGRRTLVGPSGIHCWQLVAAQGGGFTTIARHSEQGDVPNYLPDTHGQFVACGNRLYSADMSKIIAQLPSPAVYFVPNRPFILTYENNTLLVVSMNTMKAISTMTVQGEDRISQHGRVFARNQFAGGRQSISPTVLGDAVHHNLLFCFDKRLVLVPESSLLLPEEPFLYASVAPTDGLIVNRPAEIKITTQDPKATLELVSGPDGLKLTGNALSWTPKAGDVGLATARIKVSAGKAERLQEISLNVQQAFGRLPFAPDDVHLSADGKTALLVRYTSENSVRLPGYPMRIERKCRVALMQVAGDDGLPVFLAERTLAAMPVPHVAALDDHFVYLPLQDADAFLVLSRKDLSDVKRIFSPGRVKVMAAVGGKLYSACANNFSMNVVHRTVLTVPQLEQVDLHGEDNRYFPDRTGPVPVPLDGGLYYDGILYDSTLAHPRLHASDHVLISARVRGGLDLQLFDPYRQFNRLASWAVYTQGSDLLRAAGQTIGQIPTRDPNGIISPGSEPVVLTDVPAVATLNFYFKTDGGFVRANSAHARATLNFYDLQTVSPVGTATLFDETVNNQYSPQTSQLRLLSTSGRIIAVVNDRMFVVPSTGPDAILDAAKLPVPLHFINEQTCFVTGIDKPIVLHHRAKGGVGPLEYSLAIETPGMTIDKANGDITLDAKALAQSCLSGLRQSIQTQTFTASHPPTEPWVRVNGRLTITFEAQLAMYMKTVAARYAKVTGRQPHDVPMAVTLGVMAHDANQQAATMTEVIIVDVPTDMLTKYAHEAEVMETTRIVELQNEVNALRAGQGQAGIPATQPAGATDGLQRRVADLERENAVLQGKVDLLTDLLRSHISRTPAPATKPN